MDNFPEDKEPDGDIMAPHHFYVGIIISWFGFMYIWPGYPVVGSVSAIVGLLIALDDVIEHSTGIITPLELLWRRVILPVVSTIESTRNREDK